LTVKPGTGNAARASSDEERFTRMLKSTYTAVSRYARHRGLTKHDAEDLVATVYEIAWRRFEAVPAGDDALPWLLKVALNQLRNDRRRFASERATLERLPAPEHTQPPATPTLTWREIRAGLDQLNAADRELVLLIAWDGLSPAQAAHVLGYSGSTVRSRLHRARRRLARALARTAGETPAENRGRPSAATQADSWA
jgi:RNA polymerase sigma factor (sigma-70 family)